MALIRKKVSTLENERDKGTSGNINEESSKLETDERVVIL